MKNIVLGILAHVDAGKTTLAEAILYKTGQISGPGRVDSRDSFLDNNSMERQRGITIFSKQALFSMEDMSCTLLDTPGHVDFSVEMERTLQVLDYAVLVISASDGIQGQTLWKLLRRYSIPTFIFVNKMDQPGNNKDSVMSVIKKELGYGCIDFCCDDKDGEFLEQVAMCDEQILDTYLEEGSISQADIARLICERKVYPCYFGSALKICGIEELLEGMKRYFVEKRYPDSFSARAYKISRDEAGNRLTHVKLTGGEIGVRGLLNDEKINQIRVYNGVKYEVKDRVYAGEICTFLGLENTYAGQGLGENEKDDMTLLEPVLSYRIILPDTVPVRQFYPKLKQLEEELPEIAVSWNEETEELRIRLMGQVQLEIIKKIISDKYGFEPDFDMGAISYRETIANTVIGVGHFEPLRHYAEVHVRIEPNEPGAGIEVKADCSEDVLSKNWQRLILTHLKEKSFKGVLTGSLLTDVKITVVNGRAHQKHTEGGDFRQATYRAVRQGLMQAESILLEPYYRFTLELPTELVGRAMTDIESMHGNMETPDIDGDTAVISGLCPVITMRDYQINLNAYTHGRGKLFTAFGGYMPCHNTDEVIENTCYDAEADVSNPSSSVFCAHGSGFIVPWYEVFDYMHVAEEAKDSVFEQAKLVKNRKFDYSIGLEEIDEILDKTYSANKKKDSFAYKKKRAPEPVYRRPAGLSNRNKLPAMLIVDGYNVIFAHEELSSLAKQNIDSAKDRLIQILSNYQGITGSKTMLVFDGYKVKGNMGSTYMNDNIEVVYTMEGTTADQYIERYTNSESQNYNITVASSDGLIQQVTRGHNCSVISSRELIQIIEDKLNELRKNYNLDT